MNCSFSCCNLSVVQASIDYVLDSMIFTATNIAFQDHPHKFRLEHASFGSEGLLSMRRRGQDFLPRVPITMLVSSRSKMNKLI